MYGEWLFKRFGAKNSKDGQDQDKGGHCPTSPFPNDATGADQNL